MRHLAAIAVISILVPAAIGQTPAPESRDVGALTSAPATQPSGEITRLRDENHRLRSVLRQMIETRRAQERLLDTYRSQLAKYEPDFVAETSPPATRPVAPVPAPVLRPNAEIVRKFIKSHNEPAQTPQMAEAETAADLTVLQLVDGGALQVDPYNNTVWIGKVWSRQTADERLGLAQGLSMFFKKHGRPGHVLFRSLDDNSELGTYDEKKDQLTQR